MGVKIWRKPGGGETVKLGRCYSQQQSKKELSSSWIALWRRITRAGDQRKRVHHQPPNYDADSYSQNFDQGIVWTHNEPENLLRSFSSRYARSCRVSHNNNFASLI